MVHVLVVDDESGIRDSLRGILEDEGYTVSVAESGEQCLDLVQNHRYDVLLLDIWLPGVDGLEVLGKIGLIQDRPEGVMIQRDGSIETHVLVPKLLEFL